MAGWEQRRGADLSFKGTVDGGPSRLRAAGGRDVALLPLALINNGRVVLWFESAVIGGATLPNVQVPIDFHTLPGFVTPSPDGTLQQFDLDAFVHKSDSQLKLAILGWRGDGDNARDVYILRSGFYWQD